MTAVRQFSRASLSEQIREYLLDQIVSGTLAPGDRLIELKIAAEMETSQAPVREALKELEALGLVEVVRNRGSRVRVIDNVELREIYDVRAQLEGYAAQLACAQAEVLSADLMGQRDNMLAAAETDDYAEFSEHNQKFHRLIVEISGNQTLVDLWERLNIKTRTFINVQRNHSDLHALALSHNKIIEAIASGNAEVARLAAIDHVTENRP